MPDKISVSGIFIEVIVKKNVRFNSFKNDYKSG